MRLTHFTDLALRVLLVLAGDPSKRSTIDTIATDFDVSAAHLMKVTLTLGRTGWVETIRGRNGGMRLAIDPARLTVGEVVRRLEPDFVLVECFSADSACVLAGACGLETTLARARQAFFDELDKVTLAALVAATPGMARLPSWLPVSGPASRSTPKSTTKSG